MAWLSTLKMKLDTWSKRYQAFVATGDADRAACARMLEDAHAHTEHTARPEGAVIGCRDARTGALVGAVRVVAARALPHDLRDRFGLAPIPNALRKRVAVVCDVAIAPAHRKTAARAAMVERAYAHCLERGYAICAVSAPIGLVRACRALGFRAAAHAAHVPGRGLVVPMVCALHDARHLRAASAPLARVLDRWDGDTHHPSLRWCRALNPSEAYVAAYDASRDQAPAHLTHGLRYASVHRLMRHAVTVTCAPSQLLFAGANDDRTIGVVQHGAVRIEADGQRPRALGPGDVFDVRAALQAAPDQAAMTASRGGARITLLRLDAVANIDDPHDREAIAHRLARLAA